MTALARIHIAKKDLGLDDETYRALLERVTGKTSSKRMTSVEHQAVIDEMKRLGWSASLPSRSRQGRSSPLEGKYAPKLQAQWISAWNLGIVRSKHDKAMLAFVKRQTGLDHTRFLHHDEDAKKAIEGLKAWMSREANVVWNIYQGVPKVALKDHERAQMDPRARVLWAIFEKLICLGAFQPFAGELSWSDIERWAWKKGHATSQAIQFWDDASWHTAMNKAGAWLRASKAKKRPKTGKAA